MKSGGKVVVLCALAVLCGAGLYMAMHFMPHVPEKPIVVIIPSYNNTQWCERSVRSVLDQQYANYRVVYIDDCSSDDTYARVQACVQEYGCQERFTLVHNFARRGALANIYAAIQTCADDEIVIIIDGDDWVTHSHVFDIINKIYADPDVWTTYGQYVDYPLQRTGFSASFPEFIRRYQAFRFYARTPMREFPVSHLRTFYGFLGKAVRVDDLLYEGNFYQMSWDKALLCPIIEMAARHARFVPDLLYVYNMANQLNDYKVNERLQVQLHYHILRQKPYEVLAKAPWN